MNITQYVLDEFHRSKKFSRSVYPLVWDFGGACVFESRNLCKTFRVPVLEILTGFSLEIDDYNFIVLSSRPDFSNPLHLALIYHELGHLIYDHPIPNDNQKLIVYLKNEIRADTFSASHVGIHMTQLLSTLHQVYVNKNIITDFSRIMTQKRILALSNLQ